MYYYLREALKNRLISELRDSFSRHPLYAKIVPYIQNRYSTKARPQYGIIVQGSSGDQVAMAANNFVGTVVGYAMLAYVGQPVYPLEWVRDDINAIRALGGRHPSPAGLYNVEILEAPETPQGYGAFVIDPLLESLQEPVIQFRTGFEKVSVLQHLPFDRLRLWLNQRVLLEEGRDYTRQGQQITWIGRFQPGNTVRADYYYAEPSRGPFPYQWNRADFQAIPGVVLAFGRRGKAGDRVAVRVYPEAVDTAEAYGGKHEFSFDVDVIAVNDQRQMEEIADLVVMYLVSDKKPMLEFEGIEILKVSLGGEAEESYDENAEIMYYTGSVSVSIRADWEVHRPLPLAISQNTTAKKDGTNGLVQGVASSLVYATEPVVVDRSAYYDRIR